MTQPEDFNEDNAAFEGKSNAPTATEGYPSGTPIEALNGAEPVDLERDSATEAVVEEAPEAAEDAFGTTAQETFEAGGEVAFDEPSAVVDGNVIRVISRLMDFREAVDETAGTGGVIRHIRVRAKGFKDDVVAHSQKAVLVRLPRLFVPLR